MHVLSEPSTFLGTLSGPGDVSPARMQAELDRHTARFERNGVWRIIAHDTAAQDLLFTVDGAVCNSVHKSYHFWAFVFDPR